jgi:hypothetical protein
MLSIYTLIADPEWAEILTLALLFLLSLAWMSFIWGNATRLATRLSPIQWGTIYALGLFCFLSGVIILGKFIVPRNASSLLETLRLEAPLRYLTLKFQQITLSLLRPLL